MFLYTLVSFDASSSVGNIWLYEEIILLDGSLFWFLSHVGVYGRINTYDIYVAKLPSFTPTSLLHRWIEEWRNNIFIFLHKFLNWRMKKICLLFFTSLWTWRMNLKTNRWSPTVTLAWFDVCYLHATNNVVVARRDE